MMTFDISTMLDPAVYDHPVEQIRLIETHISWVILTGEYAYKIKKPVDFGFLDFSTLEKRHHYCEQELRLNRRLAADIYIEVVSINSQGPSATSDTVISGQGDAIEYAVKMKQFPQSAQLDNILSAGGLTADQMDAIAHMIAGFHRSIEIAGADTTYGDDAVVYGPVEENFIQIGQHIDTTPYSDTLSRLKQWNKAEHNRLEPVLHQRKADAFIRECHGDMHLRNMLWLEDRPLAFDCIEFNPQLRWIDVISEVAFLIMDLQDREQDRLANRFINTYLEDTGDYAGLSVLPFYLCYRAMVRAKVDVLRLEQGSITDNEKTQTLKRFESYLKLAASYTGERKASLIIMRGMSASGKSTVSQQLVDAMGAIRIRSDVERKRIFNLQSNENTQDAINAGIYSRQASQLTYKKLLELAENIIAAGYTVIVDAAFLKQEQRNPFSLLADKLDVPFTILELTAPPEVLRQRIEARRNDISDADISVLEHQLANWCPLDETEAASTITVNTAEVVNIDRLTRSLFP